MKADFFFAQALSSKKRFIFAAASVKRGKRLEKWQSGRMHWS